MNQKIYTHQVLAQKFPMNASLDTIIKAIEEELRPTGEVVCQFKVNGLNLTEEAEQRLAFVNLSEIQMIEVSSQQPGQILEKILQTWTERIPAIIELNDNLADKMRTDGVEGSLKAFVDLIDDCQLIVDSVISINRLFSHLEGVQSQAWQNAEILIADGIGQSLTAFEKKDYPLLSDVLEYDLGHALQSWLEILTTLKGTVQTLKQAGSAIEDTIQNSQSRKETD